MARKDKQQQYAVDGANVAVNRKARFEYEILDKFEAGVVLVGNEVKSLRLSQATLTDAFAEIKNGELWLNEMSITLYKMGSIHQMVDPRRPRKLLVHRREIDRLAQKLANPGTTLIPLRVYFKGGRAKIEIALAKGKRQYDKRKSIQERDQKREMDRMKKEMKTYTG